MHRKRHFGSRMQRVTVNLVAIALASLSLWFMIAATRESHRVGETCHPVDGRIWSVLIFMIASWVMTAASLFFACDGVDGDANMVALMANADDHEPINRGQCFLATCIVVFVLFSVPMTAYCVSSFLSDPIEPRFIDSFEQSFNQTTVLGNGTVPTVESFEHRGDCLVRSRVPGVYLIISIGFMYISLGLLTLGKCMWQTRVQRFGGGIGNGIYEEEDGDSDSDEDFQTFVSKSIGGKTDEWDTGDDGGDDNAAMEEEINRFRQRRGALVCAKCKFPVRQVLCDDCKTPATEQMLTAN